MNAKFRDQNHHCFEKRLNSSSCGKRQGWDCHEELQADVTGAIGQRLLNLESFCKPHSFHLPTTVYVA